MTSCDLKNILLERIVLALRPLRTIEKLVVAENYELELEALGNLFRLKRVRVGIEDDNTITFP